MSKEKPIEKELAVVLKIKAIDLMLYSSYRTMKHLHNASTDKAIQNFKEIFGLDEDDINTESAKQTINRINEKIKNNGLWQKQ